MILCGGMACCMCCGRRASEATKLWHYIRDFYCSSKRRVQYNRHLSKCFYIDMGVAQGETLSCILFDFYIDGLVQLDGV
jgi:hypothetical protein